MNNGSINSTWPLKQHLYWPLVGTQFADIWKTYRTEMRKLQGNCQSWYTPRRVRVLAHRHFVFLQNFVKSSLGRIFAKDLRFCEQLLRKIKVNTIAEEGRTWKKGSKSSPLLCNFLRQIQFLNFKIWTSQEACCLSYHFFKYKPNFTKFCTDTKPVSANSRRPRRLCCYVANFVSLSSLYRK